MVVVYIYPLNLLLPYNDNIKLNYDHNSFYSFDAMAQLLGINNE